MRRRASLLLVPVAVLALLAGCGDDDNTDTADDGTTTEAEAEAPASGGVEGGDDDEATDPGEEGDEPGSTESVPPGDPEFCTAYAEFEDTADALPQDTIEDLRTGTEVLREQLTAVAEVAPDELQEDFALLDGFFDDLQAIVDDAATVEEAEETAAAVVDEEGFDAAGERIGDYAEAACPTDDDGDGEPDTSTSTESVPE